MAKVVIVAKSRDRTKWEQGFRTHGDLIRSATCDSASYGIGGDHVVTCFAPADLAACLNVLNSPAAAAAMKFDGVLPDTVKMFVLDNELKASRRGCA